MSGVTLTKSSVIQTPFTLTVTLMLIFDIGLSVTPLFGHLECLESCESVPVAVSDLPETFCINFLAARRVL